MHKNSGEFSDGKFWNGRLSVNDYYVRNMNSAVFAFAAQVTSLFGLYLISLRFCSASDE